MRRSCGQFRLLTMVAYALAITFLISRVFLAPAAAESGPRIVVSIKPVHALVAAVMMGVGKPLLLFKNSSEMLEAELTRKQQRLIGLADLFIWIGPRLEMSLKKYASEGVVVPRSLPLLKAPGVRHLDERFGYRRLGKPTQRPKRRQAGRARVAPGASRDGNIVFRQRGARKEISGAPRRAIPHRVSKSALQKVKVDRPDPHIWLDPRNAIAMVRRITTVLIEMDPQNAGSYRRNSAALYVRIEGLDEQLTAILRPIRKRRYVVLNNRLQYFEEHYLLVPAVEFKLSLTSGNRTSLVAAGRRAARIGSGCVIAAAALSAKEAAFVAAQSKGRLVLIDAFGDRTKSGPDAFFDLVLEVGTQVANCIMPPKRTRR